MSEISLELKNIKKSFQEGEDVLDDICLTAKKGEFVTLLGSSGCGKTTTLRIIAGLEQPDSGQVFLNGKDVTGLEPNRRNVNTVFQNYALFPHMNVADNIGYGLKLKKTPKAEISRRVKEMLELVQLTGFEKRKPSELSGGQRQRVAIARALVNNPEVLLLDEPLGALDLQLRRAMQHELKHLQKKLGITFIYITHDQEEAINMSDTIAVMNHGRFEQIGTPDEIYNHPKTSYVATFVGNANILKGVVKESADNNNHQITIITESGEVQVLAASEENMPQPGETVTIAVRSENIRFEESVKNIQGNSTGNIHGLTAKVTEKTFAGGQLRVVLKTTDGQEIIASRYGIDTNVNVGETVRCCFKPSDAVLVDRPEANAETNTQKAQRDNQSTTGGTHA
ncbi:ABC transporter ATP-binding protein [Blautia schinkii]|uniref:ABC transporter ATP-binding protein n=1 Tax=Blautia schinkii TaxID=180164 RepID=UPI00156E083C|nr:ABC transporter ATP-binding protein [Blautia schinkii]NSK36723.1 ABC transporter ATP-binding protein [Blautia schinkii]NSK67412.1 ABC transporter ATP-binding protein [Blautia schinkii]